MMIRKPLPEQQVLQELQRSPIGRASHARFRFDTPFATLLFQQSFLQLENQAIDIFSVFFA